MPKILVIDENANGWEMLKKEVEPSATVRYGELEYVSFDDL